MTLSVPHIPGMTLNRIYEVVAGKVTLADALAIASIIQEDFGERYRDVMDWIAVATPLLPRRSHSKVNRRELIRFVWAQRSWFRLSAFADFFEVHEKTAWEYLKTLHEQGLLAHNGERSSRVRYRIELPGATQE